MFGFNGENQVIESVLSAMAKDWAIARSDEERNVMLENAKYARFISYVSVALASGVMLAFSSVRVIAIIFYTFPSCSALVRSITLQISQHFSKHSLQKLTRS